MTTLATGWESLPTVDFVGWYSHPMTSQAKSDERFKIIGEMIQKAREKGKGADEGYRSLNSLSKCVMITHALVRRFVSWVFIDGTPKCTALLRVGKVKFMESANVYPCSHLPHRTREGGATVDWLLSFRIRKRRTRRCSGRLCRRTWPTADTGIEAASSSRAFGRDTSSR